MKEFELYVNLKVIKRVNLIKMLFLNEHRAL